MFDDQITLRHEPLVLRAVAVGINGERIDLFIDQITLFHDSFELWHAPQV